jgi:hypothetical protein
MFHFSSDLTSRCRFIEVEQPAAPLTASYATHSFDHRRRQTQSGLNEIVERALAAARPRATARPR